MFNYLMITMGLVFSLCSPASEVVYPASRSKLDFAIVKVSPGSAFTSATASYVLELEGGNGITHYLICKHKESAQEKIRSVIVYRNVANLKAGEFKFSSHKVCEKLARYLESTFEFIGPENYIHVRVDTTKQKFDFIKLPNLDPYIDHIPQKVPKAENVFY